MNIHRLSSILIRAATTTSLSSFRIPAVTNLYFIPLNNHLSQLMENQHNKFHTTRGFFDEHISSENNGVELDSTKNESTQNIQPNAEDNQQKSSAQPLPAANFVDYDSADKNGQCESSESELKDLKDKDFNLEGSATNSMPEDKPLRFDRLYSNVQIQCRSHEIAILRSYAQFALLAAGHLGVEVCDVKYPRRLILRRTVLKSAYVHKKHRVQYETRTLFLILQILHITESTLLTYLEYIQRNIPEGVSMNVRTTELCRFPKFVEDSGYYKYLDKNRKISRRQNQTYWKNA